MQWVTGPLGSGSAQAQEVIVQFDDNRVDTGGVDDLRGNSTGGFGSSGGGGGNGMANMALIGLLTQLLRGRGGKWTLLLLLLVGGFMLWSSGMFAQTAVSTQPQGAASDLATRCNTEGAIEQYSDCLLAKAFNETDEVWSEEFQRRGMDYRAPRLAFFSTAVNTACGQATTEVGPFYCPGDERIYFDLGFAKDLQKLGVKGDYANVYIMAHEFGHHLQNITGIEAKVRELQAQNKKNANKYGIAMELQADCMAGVWSRLANDRGNLSVTPEELVDAQNAAAAVGDDRIQAGAGVRVNPDTWTHGSSKQRQEWYMVGWNTSDINRCNSFANLS
ncbi:MAG: neutral zinc metallopeptidase [Candidatus Nanopelagicales bacterium]